MSWLRISASLNRLENRDVTRPTTVAAVSMRRRSGTISGRPSCENPYACISAIRDAAAIRGIATARRARATAAPPSARATNTVKITVRSSYLDRHDPLDGERSHGQQDRADYESQPSAAALEQRLGIARVQHAHEHEQGNREHRDDPARHPSLCGQCLNQPAQLAALARGSGDLVEDLCRIATGLALEPRHEDHLLEIA